MFAVVKTGGKQSRVAGGDVITVEKLVAEEGATVSFDEVLMLGGDEVKVGAPLVAGASVTAEVLEQVKGPKVVSFVKRRRKHSSQRRRGHRQQLTRVRIIDILAGGAKAAKAKAKATTPVEAEPALEPVAAN
jgi:large subunit ribosomal protein L21